MALLPHRCAPVTIALLLGSVAAGCGSSGESSPNEQAPEPKPASSAYKGDPPELVQAWIDAIETCAVGTPDGGYSGCTDRDKLIQAEPALADAPGTTTITPGDDPQQSYILVVEHEGATFTYNQLADGTVSQQCTPSSAPVCSGG